MPYWDPRLDAPVALAAGGVGALSGLVYSLLNKKQKKNKLRNALIGAAALPAAYLGSRYLTSKTIPIGGLYDYMYENNPLYSRLGKPLYKKLYKSRPHEARDKYRQAKKDYQEANEEVQKALERAPGYDGEGAYDYYSSVRDKARNAMNDAERAYDLEDDWNYNITANIMAALGYGTLGAGIGLPALYLNYLKKKKKKNPEKEIA